MRIDIKIFLFTLLILPTAALTQTSIPSGTILSAQLNTSVDSHKLKPGSKVTARIMQDVPGTKVHSGAKLIGEIVNVDAPKGRPSQITLRFDTIKFKHKLLHVKTSLRALASMMEVEDAQTPSVGTDRGSPWAWMPHTLIGGEVAYGQGGPVVNGGDVVGTSLFGGVLVPAHANPSRGCRGEVDGNNQPQALWVFASDACGIYGMNNIRIGHDGRSAPQGEITLSSREGRFLVRSGSGMLLRVNSNSP